MDFITLTYIALGVLVFWLLSWRLTESPTTFGSAGWLKAWVASGKNMFRKGGLLLGDWTGLLPVYYRGSGHALTVAPTGWGKGTTTIIPNLLRHDLIFLLDPGGENTAVASKSWRDKGYAFYCLNPWGMFQGEPWSLPSHSLNPLEQLDPASESFSSNAELLADMIVVRSGSETGSAAYFKEEAASGIRAFLMHIMTAEPKARQNLLTLREYISADAEAWGETDRGDESEPGGGRVDRARKRRNTNDARHRRGKNSRRSSQR